MDTNFTLIPRLDTAIALQKESIVSKTVYVDDYVKVVLMALDAGQELSEHTASMPAIIHLLEGDADVTLGQDAHRLKAGAWVHMPANLTHSVCAISPTIFLLLLLKTAKRP